MVSTPKLPLSPEQVFHPPNRLPLAPKPPQTMTPTAEALDCSPDFGLQAINGETDAGGHSV